jgi:hypothetical protein
MADGTHTHILYLLLSGLEYICTTAEAETRSEFTMFAFWITPQEREREKVPLKIKQSQFQPNEMAPRSPMCQWARNKIESVHFGSTSHPKTPNHCRGVPCLVIDGANFLAKPIKIANHSVLFTKLILCQHERYRTRTFHKFPTLSATWNSAWRLESWGSSWHASNFNRI